MFRDEGTEPVIEFRQRMMRRVTRTPTSIVVAALPLVIVARLSLLARSYYLRNRCNALARRIDPRSDLRFRTAEPCSPVPQDTAPTAAS